MNQSVDKIAVLRARMLAQSGKSPVNSNQTVKEDIEDALSNGNVSDGSRTSSVSGHNNGNGSNIPNNLSIGKQIAVDMANGLSALERLRAKLGKISSTNGVVQSTQPNPEVQQSSSNQGNQDPVQTTDRNGNSIIYNARQQRAVSLGGSGKSLVIIGPAGTGKTTCQKGVVQELERNDVVGLLDAEDHKYLKSQTPAIVIVAYTRRAVANIRRNMPSHLQDNCITIHKLLEYEPEYIEYLDEEGNEKKKMVFSPQRNEGRPLPSSIRTIIYEESSMLGTDLYNEVQAALDHEVQEIFLGDIQQLPPVFGPAILGFKLLSLPVVELTEVYRQALESPILRLAHRILSGKGIPSKEFKEWNEEGKLLIKPWTGKFHWEHALPPICTFLTKAIDNGFYNPEEDVVLCPFNKGFGTDEINKKIANHLARKRGAETYQIIAGRNKHFFSPGDKVLFDKEDATILKIEINPGYVGKKPIPHSIDLDYWGCMAAGKVEFDLDNDDDDMEAILKSMQNGEMGEDEEGERKRKASHRIQLQMHDTDRVITIDTVGDINLLMLGFALTVHKSQGSEWKKVFFILHQSHNTMIQRELLYTGVTRAREQLILVCETDTLEKGIRSQRVKGDTIEEKAEFFKGKEKQMEERIGK